MISILRSGQRNAVVITLLVLLLGSGCMSSSRLSGAAGILDESIPESSGLAPTRDPSLFWTLNDSGNDPEIFAVDLDGRLSATIVIEGVENSDWEAITNDEHGSLYIGDIGNNENQRRDLVIHQIDEPDPHQSGTARVRRSIHYHYEDQTGFPDPANRNFDAEAMFIDEGNLFLLSKHRSDTNTNLYVIGLGDSSADVVARRISSFPIGSMVTDAAISPDHRILAVLTYAGLHFFEREGDDFLAHHLKEIRFYTAVTLQCEGLAWVGDDAIAFTNEQRAIHYIDRPLRDSIRTYPDPRKR